MMYAFMWHCSFQICSHIHPKSFDAVLNIPRQNIAVFLLHKYLHKLYVTDIDVVYKTEN